MLFNFKYRHYDYKNLTSGQVRKLLSAMNYSVKQQKAFISKTINAYKNNRPHYAVQNIPHITIVPTTIARVEKPIDEVFCAE